MKQEIDTHNLIVPYGRYKDQLWTRVPVQYLKWMINRQVPYFQIAQAELDRRGTVLQYTVEISGHAIDRASITCLQYWVKTAKEDEGLHAWLHRKANEALEHLTLEDRENGEEAVVYENMKFVFSFGMLTPSLKTVMPYEKPYPLRKRSDTAGSTLPDRRNFDERSE